MNREVLQVPAAKLTQNSEHLDLHNPKSSVLFFIPFFSASFLPFLIGGTKHASPAGSRHREHQTSRAQR
jgi:hypothetical protein